MARSIQQENGGSLTECKKNLLCLLGMSSKVYKTICWDKVDKKNWYEIDKWNWWNEIETFVHNHVKLGVSLRVLYCAMDTGYGLGRSQGDWRPALPKGRKYQMMVKTQTESHVPRLVVWTNRWQIWVFFSFEVRQGMAGICQTCLWWFSQVL